MKLRYSSDEESAENTFRVQEIESTINNSSLNTIEHKDLVHKLMGNTHGHNEYVPLKIQNVEPKGIIESPDHFAFTMNALQLIQNQVLPR